MPHSTSKPNPALKSLLDKASLRAERVWLLVDVMFLTWAFFCFFLWMRGYETATAVCLTQVIAYAVIQLLFRKKQQYLATMNLYMICSGLGVFFVAVSHPNLSQTIFFFPVSILVASCLFGIRQATHWLFATVFHFVAYFCYEYGFHETIAGHFDSLALSLGVAFCSYFCCRQAEASYENQTEGLVDLSDKLQKRSDELELLATTDSLTGLTNRYQFQNELEELVTRATDKEKVALFLIDMDRFKEVNDTLGHATGDEVLVEIGKRLSSRFGQRASITRLGGDEFCLMFDKISAIEKVDEIAKEIVEALTARYHLSEIELTLGTSVGYALCPDHAQTGKHILSFADTAMYHAKRNKQNVARYQSDMTDRLSADRQMQDQLAVALERDEFYLVYQPQIDTTTGKMFSAEALMRWRHDGQTVSPARFIPLLETTGQIVEVSKWLLREACRQQAQWNKQGHDIMVSVNVSALQFIDDDFVDSVVRPLNEFGVSPNMLDLEITEGILVENVDHVIEKLKQLSDLGCKISIDDFGTGYSSLAYLRRFPLDKLKIDRTFVKEIPDGDDGVIASSIIMLAELLELEVIAEGVETVEQLQFLKDYGCTQFQGFYFSVPVDAEEITSIASSHQTASLQS